MADNLIRFICAGCRKELKARRSAAGFQGACPRCGALNTIPDTAAYANIAVPLPGAGVGTGEPSPLPSPPSAASYNPPNASASTSGHHGSGTNAPARPPAAMRVENPRNLRPPPIPELRPARPEVAGNRRWIVALLLLVSCVVLSTFYPVTGILFVTTDLVVVAVYAIPFISDRSAILPVFKTVRLPKSVKVFNELIAVMFRLRPDRPQVTVLKLCFAVLVAFLAFATAASKIRSNWTDQEFAGLMAGADAALQKGDVAGAELQLNSAQQLDVSGGFEASSLLDRIQGSRDTTMIRSALLDATDDEFDAFAKRSQLSGSLERGYGALDRMEIALARPMIGSIKAERDARAIKLAADAEEARQQAAADEAAAQAKAKKEAARQVAEAKNYKREIDDASKEFMTAVEENSVARTLVDRIAVERDQQVWTATITVKNFWHIRPKQIRLQDAQVLQRCWQSATFSIDEDKARIKIVDLNGNVVGGSRWYAGSRIWVQD